MLSYEFLVGRLGKIIDLEESGLNADLQIAKQQLQCGLLNQSKSTLKTIIASGNEDKIPACNYTLGKVYYAMNRYEEALECYQVVLKGDPLQNKYYNKALANLATTKVMAANYKDAFAYLD